MHEIGKSDEEFGILDFLGLVSAVQGCSSPRSILTVHVIENRVVGTWKLQKGLQGRVKEWDFNWNISFGKRERYQIGNWGRLISLLSAPLCALVIPLVCLSKAPPLCELCSRRTEIPLSDYSCPKRAQHESR